MRVAVTGASGFVGVNLVRKLIAAGYDVVAIDRTMPDPAALVGPALQHPERIVGPGEAQHPEEAPGPGVGLGSVIPVEADVLDPAAMRDAVDGAELVFHLAAKITLAESDAGAWELNTRGVATVARATLDAGVRRMVHCSSVHAFDETRCGDVMSESSLRATAADLPVYDRSKYAGELELLAVVERGLDAVICNPTGIYGPVDPPGRVSRLNAMVLDGALGRAPASVAGGFDLVDVRDVVSGLMLAAEHGRAGENYLLPGGMVTMHELLTAAASAAGRLGPIAAVPLGVLRAVLPLAAPIGKAFGSDVMSASALRHLTASPPVDGSKARTELGYAPRPFTETVRDLVALYVRSGTLARRGRNLQRV